jgi:EAL and modified HD-GYP domain-containing signal transduction protein
MSEHQFFLGRQAIVGRRDELIAYELLFRSSQANAAFIVDDVAASAAVIQHLFVSLGIGAALGGKRGFINVSEHLLLDDSIELLPPDQVVLEILETVPLTPNIIARCKVLKDAGYALAFDDITQITQAHEPLLPLIDVVKLDVLAMQPAQIEATVRALKPYKLKLLAEKIDTPEQFNFCLGLDFDLFQGYFFAKPVILSGYSMQPSALVLLNLLGLLAADAEIQEIENVLKQAPDLTMHLLKMVNSAAFNLARKISSVRSAIAMLGRIQLTRLVQIMLFSQQSNGRSATNPLLQTAVIRGRMMEGLAGLLGCAPLRNRAFMVGVLSLAGTLFHQPLAQLLESINLEASIREALLNSAGQLGTMLQMIEASERPGDDETAQLLTTLDLKNLDAFNRLHTEALTWASQFV